MRGDKEDPIFVEMDGLTFMIRYESNRAPILSFKLIAPYIQVEKVVMMQGTCDYNGHYEIRVGSDAAPATFDNIHFLIKVLKKLDDIRVKEFTGADTLYDERIKQ
jgi:hypothetical protein